MFRFVWVIVFACALFVATPSQAVLLGHWQFNDLNNLGIDSAGGDNNGVQQGTDSSFTNAARLGAGALAVDGTGIGLRLDNSADYQNLTTFTIASFIKPDFNSPNFDSGGGVIGRVFGALGIDGSPGGTQFGTNTGYGFGARPDGGLRFTTFAVRDFDVLGTTLASPLQADEWAHVAVTVTEPGLANFYINGVNIGTIDDARNPLPTTNPFHIGVAGFGDADPYAGLIDDMRVYNEALDAAAIAALANPGGTPRQGLLLSIDRDTGGVTLENDSTAPVTVTGYSVRSVAGSLDPVAWQPLADADPNWIVLSDAATDLSEGILATATLAAGQIITAGDVWLKNPFEDLEIEFLLENGSTIQGAVEYTGNGGESFRLGDFDFDNEIDLDDFEILNNGIFSDVSTLTDTAAYLEGDINSDGMVDELDFVTFKNIYLAGGGSAAALAGFGVQVPEPTSIVLMGLALVGSVLLSRRARGSHAGLLAMMFVGLASTAAQAQLTPVFEYRFPASYDGSSTAVTDLSPAGNHGTANVQSAGTPPFELSTNIPAGEPAANRALNYGTTFGQITTNGLSLLNNAAVEAAGGITYDLWFNPNGVTQQNRKMLDYAGTEWINYSSAGPGGLPTVRVSFGNSQFARNIQTGFETNGWNRIRTFFDTSGNTIDANGNLAGRMIVVLNDTLIDMGVGNKTAAGDNLNRPISLGRHPTISGEHYRGLLYNPSVYFGVIPFEDPITLQVNTATGAVSLSHDIDDVFPDARDIDSYKIASADGSIVLANWTSLESQAFDAGAANDGDYNNNGRVDAADYTVWRDNLGAGTSLPNDSIGTPIGQAHYDQWEANFGGEGGGAGWREFGAPNPNAIGESSLLGSSVLDDGVSASLGDIFEVGGEQDWILTYHVVGEATFRTGRVEYDGGGAGSNQAVPEPASLTLIALLAVGLLVSQRRSRLAALPLMLLAIAGFSPPMAQAQNPIDRLYLLGEGAGEGGVAEATVGSGNSFGITFDNVGTGGAGDLQDLTPFGGPVYADTSSRPLAGGGTQLGVQFDGADDYLFGVRLGLPATTQSSTQGVPPGPHDYSGITHRGLQFWTNPLDSFLGQGNQQSVLVDTNQHGVLISEDDTWIMKYRNVNFDSEVAVATGEGASGWSHVMLLQPNGPSSGGSVLYVDGIAVAAGGTGYVGTDNTPLVIGSNTALDGTGNFTGGTADFFAGVVDNLEMFVLGTSLTTGADYGTFDFATDNEFAADALAGTVLGDLTGDGLVTGDGTGSPATDDVAALIANWGAESVINNRRVGDLSTRILGDFNVDGVIDLHDWDILRDAHAGGAGLDLAALLQGRTAVPEPASVALFVIAIAWLAWLRTKRTL